MRLTNEPCLLAGEDRFKGNMQTYHSTGITQHGSVGGVPLGSGVSGQTAWAPPLDTLREIRCYLTGQLHRSGTAKQVGKAKDGRGNQQSFPAASHRDDCPTGWREKPGKLSWWVHHEQQVRA